MNASSQGVVVGSSPSEGSQEEPAHVIVSMAEWERISASRGVYEVCSPLQVQRLTRILPDGEPEECVLVPKDLLD
jgi:hypothetical protein